MFLKFITIVSLAVPVYFLVIFHWRHHSLTSHSLFCFMKQSNPTQQASPQVRHSYLTCFPWIRTRRQSLTMFHEVLFSYRIRFKAIATCEWQLSQQRLCFEEDKEYKWLLFPSSKQVKHMSTRPLSYHPVLVLLWSIIHGCVPGVGAAGIDFANIKHPVPVVRQKNKVCRADERKQVGAISLTQYWEICANKTRKSLHLLTLLVFQKPCCLPAKRKTFVWQQIQWSCVSRYLFNSPLLFVLFYFTTQILTERTNLSRDHN